MEVTMEVIMEVTQETFDNSVDIFLGVAAAVPLLQAWWDFYWCHLSLQFYFLHYNVIINYLSIFPILKYYRYSNQLDHIIHIFFDFPSCNILYQLKCDICIILIIKLTIITIKVILKSLSYTLYRIYTPWP